MNYRAKDHGKKIKFDLPKETIESNCWQYEYFDVMGKKLNNAKYTRRSNTFIVGVLLLYIIRVIYILLDSKTMIY